MDVAVCYMCLRTLITPARALYNSNGVDFMNVNDSAHVFVLVPLSIEKGWGEIMLLSLLVREIIYQVAKVWSLMYPVGKLLGCSIAVIVVMHVFAQK